MTRTVFINEINVAGAYRYDTYAGTTVEPWQYGEIVTFGFRGKFKVLITSCEKVILVPHGPRPWYVRAWRRTKKWIKRKKRKTQPKSLLKLESKIVINLAKKNKGVLVLIGCDFPSDSWVKRSMLKPYEAAAKAQGINLDNYERFYAV
jgi:hypothetical protein